MLLVYQLRAERPIEYGRGQIKYNKSTYHEINCQPRQDKLFTKKLNAKLRLSAEVWLIFWLRADEGWQRVTNGINRSDLGILSNVDVEPPR